MRRLKYLAVFMAMLFGCAAPKETPAPAPPPPEIAEEESAGDNTEQEKTGSEPVPEPPMPKETELTSKSTPLVDKKENRLKNISLAVEAANQTIVKPGEEFSFNNTVGARTPKKGYKKAIIFVDKKKVKEIGGGVCQLATTIYQAAVAADLEIVERHEHKLDVTYAQKGEDATVFYGKLDMRFKNTTQQNLRVECSMDGEQVVVRLVAIGN